MRLTIEQNHLQILLARVTGAVSKRNTIPVLANVKLIADTAGTLTAVATDLDLEVTAKQPAQVDQAGHTTANAVMLAGIVGKLPKGSLVSLSHDGQYLHVKAGRSEFKLATLPVEDFPIMASNEYQSKLDFQGLELKNALDKTIWAASTEEMRYMLNGVLLQHREGHATFTATDGHRLAHYKDGETESFPEVIIPANAVKQFIGALDDGEATVEVSETKIKLTYGDVVIVSKVIDGTFPDWSRSVPTRNNNSITLPSIDAKAAIERVALVATDRVKSVKFDVAGGELTLLVRDAQGGQATEVMQVEQVGEDVSIGLNSRYALDAFAQADKGDVTIHYGGPMDTLKVTYDKEPGMMAVVMPLRIN